MALYGDGFWHAFIPADYLSYCSEAFNARPLDPHGAKPILKDLIRARDIFDANNPDTVLEAASLHYWPALKALPKHGEHWDLWKEAFKLYPGQAHAFYARSVYKAGRYDNRHKFFAVLCTMYAHFVLKGTSMHEDLFFDDKTIDQYVSNLSKLNALNTPEKINDFVKTFQRLRDETFQQDWEAFKTNLAKLSNLPAGNKSDQSPRRHQPKHN